MSSNINIAVHLAPKDFQAYKRWHKAACKLDNLTAEQRWVKMGNKLPDVSKSDTRAKKKK